MLKRQLRLTKLRFLKRKLSLKNGTLRFLKNAGRKNIVNAQCFMEISSVAQKIVLYFYSLPFFAPHEHTSASSDVPPSLFHPETRTIFIIPEKEFPPNAFSPLALFFLNSAPFILILATSRRLQDANGVWGKSFFSLMEDSHSTGGKWNTERRVILRLILCVHVNPIAGFIESNRHKEHSTGHRMIIP